MKAKNILIIVLILAILVVATFFIYTKVIKSSENSQNTEEIIRIDESFADKNFGRETIKLIESGKIEIACEDAKHIINMIGNINKDFANNPELSGDMAPDKMTDSMKVFEATMDVFGKELEDKYSKDEAKMNAIYQSIGDGFSNIFQVTVMTHLGLIDKAKQDEYVDVTFCGVAPKEGYVSPLDMKIEEGNIQEKENSVDNPEEKDTPKIEDNISNQDGNIQKDTNK